MHILWLKTELLHPVDKGGRIRTYQTLRALARSHQVTYLALDDGGAAPNARELAKEYAHDVITVPFSPPERGTLAFYADLAKNAVSRLPYAVGKYRSPRFEDEIRRLAPKVDVVLCDFLAPAVNVPKDLGKTPAVLFQHNVEAEIWRRHAEVAKHPVKRAYMQSQFRRMLRFEREACRRFDHVIAVSEQDAELMRRQYQVTRVTAQPTGVDIDFFRPQPETTRNTHELVFLGSMDWLPNEDGVAWFVEEVFPLVRKKEPKAKLTIVGRKPSPRVKNLAVQHAGVEVTGTVDDVRPYLARAAALVVPLRIGGGTRLKIYEAMAMGIPVVSTTVGAEGLPLEHEEHFLRADEPATIASACHQVFADPSAAGAMGERAAEYVRSRFGWDGVAAQFAEVCRQAAFA
ncbi:MAG: glycosyltransferase [Labilithrix sp.]|nr:glycosyltransferase [Labilithrix sp.]MCW5813764.1 glycosyltransferase [Labilithrix sp.]